VLLCFIKPILGNRYVRSRGLIVSEPRESHPRGESHPRSEIADVATLLCPPLDNLGCPDPHPSPVTSLTPVAGSIFGPLSLTQESGSEFSDEILRSALLDIQPTFKCPVEWIPVIPPPILDWMKMDEIEGVLNFEYFKSQAGRLPSLTRWHHISQLP